MKLIYAAASPYARMVLVTAHEVGLAKQVEIVQSGPLPPTGVNEAVTKVNPLGKVPCLVTDHGHSLYDSRVICEYLCHHAGDKRLLPDEPVKRFRLLTLQALGQGMCDTALGIRYEVTARPEPMRWAEWLERNRLRLVSALDEIERSWTGELAEMNAGSIAAACALGYLDLRFGDMNWRGGRPKTAAAFEKLASLPSMQATVPTG
ncbi:MAG: glutathione S-transferase [Hyphomicrobiales bacterium]